MAHCEKYNRAQMGQLLHHYEHRHNTIDGHIDMSRSNLNYNLAADDQPLPAVEYLRARFEACPPKHDRKDLVVLRDWVITAPKDLHERDHDAFFKTSYEFIADRYGRENIVSAWVHLDETTPHVHVALTPVVDGHFNSKEFINIIDLRSFHRDLDAEMRKVFGRDIGVINGATREGNKSIDELKRGTAAKKVKALEKETEELERRAAGQRATLADQSKEIADNSRVLKSHRERLQRIHDFDEMLERLERRAEKKGYVKINKSEYDILRSVGDKIDTYLRQDADNEKFYRWAHDEIEGIRAGLRHQEEELYEAVRELEEAGREHVAEEILNRHEIDLDDFDIHH